jgi:hypothetical protein
MSDSTGIVEVRCTSWSHSLRLADTRSLTTMAFGHFTNVMLGMAVPKSTYLPLPALDASVSAVRSAGFVRLQAISNS